MATGITFAVDEVEPATERLVERDDVLEERVKRRVLVAPQRFRGVAATVPRIAVSPDGVSMDLHPLVAALQRAYSEHRPFVLTPDAVAIAMAQGVALHIRENHEALRGRFVRHAGRKTLEVKVPDPSSIAGWETAIGAMTDRLAVELGQGPVNLFTRPLSTTGRLERVAGQIALMDAFAPYFDYEVVWGCGIPAITLTGTPDDWRDIRARLDVFAEWGLGWWRNLVRPLCNQWIATAEGRIDRLFWQRIYSSSTDYLDQTVSGWILRLFPYLRSRRDETRVQRNEIRPASGDSIWLHEPVALRSFPSGLSQVEARVTTEDRDADRAMLVDLVGGFVGVGQAADGLALSPLIGWAVCEAATARIWDALEKHHQTRSPVDRRGSKVFGVPALLVELYERYDSVELWGGALRVRNPDQLESMSLPPSSTVDKDADVEIVAFADLADGSFLGYIHPLAMRHPLRWAIVHVPGTGALDLATITVVADTPLELWQKLLDGDAPYFLAPGAALKGSLAEALERTPIVVQRN